MITWLFTQVWLWSLAAFALGALITWLLFVRPVQRRLAEYEAAQYDHGSADHDEPGYDEDGYDQPGYVEPETAREPLDLLHPARPHDADEPPIGDWDRPPRAWADPRLRAPEDEDTENSWFRRWDESVQHADPEAPPDVAVTAVRPRVPVAEQRAEPADGPSGRDGSEADPAETTQRSEPGAETAARGGPAAEDGGARGEPSPETAGAGPAETGASSDGAERGETAASQDEDAAATPGEEPAPELTGFAGQLTDPERLSGQLRSLLESMEDGAQPETPYVPPVGAEATQVIPVVEDPDAPPLPHRTPGAGPHPGQDHGWSGTGPMVKGHSASRQYHTPDSPHYSEIVADVWFRSAKDAEIAGFEPWNGRRAARG